MIEAEEAKSKAKTEIRSEAISDLRPELKPVAERHGLELVQFAVRCAALNTIMDVLIDQSGRHKSMAAPVQSLVNTQTDILNMFMQAKGWDWDKLIECMQDIGRAAKLAGHRMSPGNDQSKPS